MIILGTQWADDTLDATINCRVCQFSYFTISRLFQGDLSFSKSLKMLFFSRIRGDPKCV